MDDVGWRWGFVVALPWWALLVAAAPRDRAAWAWAGLALAVRVAVAPWGCPLPPPKGAMMDRIALGTLAPPSWGQDAYGDALASVSAPWFALTGAPDAPYVLAVAWSAATVAWTFAGVAGATGDRRSAHAAAAVLACLPVHVAMAGMVSRFALGGFAAVVGVAAALGDRRRDAWLAALSAVVVAHARPTLVPVAVGIVALLAWRARGPAAVAGLAVLVRVVQIGVVVSHGAGSGAMADQVFAWGPDPGWGSGAHLLPLDPGRFPAGVAILALAGVALAPRRVGLPLAVALALTTLPYRHFPFDFDRLRMQAVGWPWWAAAAGIGLGAVGARHRGAGVAAAVALAASLVASRGPVDPWWSWVPEGEALRAGLRAYRPSVVAVDRSLDAHELPAWLRLRGVDRVVDPGEAPSGTLRFVGLADHLRTGGRPDLDGWEPMDLRAVSEDLGGWWPPTGRDVTVGWVRRAP